MVPIDAHGLKSEGIGVGTSCYPKNYLQECQCCILSLVRNFKCDTLCILYGFVALKKFPSCIMM